MRQLDEKFTKVDETQELVKRTVNAVFDIVGSTMGPDGNVVVIQEGTAVKTTKDGATVARSLEFSNFHEDKINQIMAEAARKTELECGDGTTTTIFLTKLYYDLFRTHTGFIKRQYIERFTTELINVLKDMTVSVDIDDPRLRQVANITANQDASIVEKVIDIFRKFENPIFELKEGTELEDKVAELNGMPLRMQMADPTFSSTGTGSATEFKGLHYVVVNANFTDARMTIDQLAGALEPIGQKYPEATIALVVNQASTTFCGMVNGINHHLKNNNLKLRYTVFNTNLGGSLGSLIMGDLAAVLNAPLVTALDQIINHDLHYNEETIISTLTGSTVMNPSPECKERIDARVKDIKASLSSMAAGNRFSPMGRATERRMAELMGQIVTIYVGGETMSDIKERKDRFEDVSLAVRSAMVNGILPGCGIALRDASVMAADAVAALDESFPSDIIQDMVRMCFGQWRHLAGIEDELDMTEVRNIVKDRTIKDLATGREGTPEELGVYDTAYASIAALKGGMTTAKILANTSSIILGNRAGAVVFENKR